MHDLSDSFDLKELHWLLAIVQSMDVGIVVLDLEYRVCVWNGFMQNHSGRTVKEASQQSFFDLFPEVSQTWFRHKMDSVVTLGMPAFTVWEQRPYLVRFRNYQPITGQDDLMYQNTTWLPLVSTNSQVEHVCLIIYDVTIAATSRKQLESLNTQLEQLAHKDRLTGLNNRGYWEELLRQEFARYTRYNSMAALLIFDIDHFKKINDTYGHQAGDKVIQALARLILTSARVTDIAGRYGGEEFVILMPGTDCMGARLFAERFRKRVESLIVPHEDKDIRFTISIGIADLSQPLKSHEQLIHNADQALYLSKNGGRNRVTLFSEVSPNP
ncbi:diguanylate cyclase (GGDEF)-like protein [Azomonas agilis]|uniref:diguanylate cyclase n=1 Tax=Azomonas agilis TaxID=116849 RepID=A0A562I2X4_9GAMM|nr:diguanylate cyclase [Azomonas agilis]TWH65038.1 diguanylate cyclase (GGDEF)-like protein [Azomonas agilis]